MEKKNRMFIVKMNKLDRELKTCLEQGNPMLIEDMKEDLNPLLEPVLTK